jgi:hypothetical protein
MTTPTENTTVKVINRTPFVILISSSIEDDGIYEAYKEMPISKANDDSNLSMYTGIIKYKIKDQKKVFYAYVSKTTITTVKIVFNNTDYPLNTNITLENLKSHKKPGNDDLIRLYLIDNNVSMTENSTLGTTELFVSVQKDSPAVTGYATEQTSTESNNNTLWITLGIIAAVIVVIIIVCGIIFAIYSSKKKKSVKKEVTQKQ